MSISGSTSRFEALKGYVSQKYEAAKENATTLSIVAFPKIHALFMTNYEAATVQNKDLKVKRYNPIGFNRMIDFAINKIGQDGETRDTIACYLEGRKEFRDFDNDDISIPFSPEMMQQKQELIDKIPATNTHGIHSYNFDNEHLKTELIKLKQASEGSEFSAKIFTKFINLSTSLANTAAQSKEVESTDLSAQRLSLDLERVQKIGAAGAEYSQSLNQLAELELLLRDLSAIDNRTTAGDIDVYFHQFVALTEDMKELYGTGHELAASVKDLLDQLDGSPESKINFYNDLLKPESDYLQILLRSVVKAREEVIEKAALLNLAHREVRTEGFDKFDLRYDPRTGIFFKDVFNICNNLELPTKLLSKLVQRLNTSLIDPSKGSFFATAANVVLVGLFVIYKMVQAVVSFGLASICYLGGSVAWGIGKSGRYIFGQGFDRLKDHFKKTNIPKNNNLDLQAEIAKSDRPTNLLTGLRLTDFYKAYEAHEAAKAEEARILEAGKKAEELIATCQRALEAIAAAHALTTAKQNGSSLTQSLEVSSQAVAAARQNVELMFRSLGSRGGSEA